MALTEAKTEVKAESEQFVRSLQEEVAELQRAVAGLTADVSQALSAEEIEAASAARARAEAVAEVGVANEAHERSLAQARACFEEQRRDQVAGVVSRFEREHFELSAMVAAEVKLRQAAEQERDRLVSWLEGLRQDTSECLLEPSRAAGPAAAAAAREARGTQTEPGGAGAEEPPPLSPRHETLVLRLADLEARLSAAICEEAARLQIVEHRMRRTVALKNDMIDELKTELWRKEREILEARGILAGLRADGGGG